MNAVTPLLRAALAPHRLRSLLLVGLVIALAAAGIAASMIVRSSTAERVDAAFAANRGGDLAVYVPVSNVDAATSLLAADPHVVQVGEPVAVSEASIVEGDSEMQAELRTTSRAGALNAPVVVAGRQPTGAGEVLLDAGLAADEGTAVGDRITVRGAQGSLGLTVVGTAYDFTDCLYPNCDPPHVWVSATTFTELADIATANRLLAVDVDDLDAVGTVVDRVRDELGDDLLGWNDWPDTRGDMVVETDFFGTFLGAFGVFVMLSCAVVVASAIGARTVARRRTIGLYKSIGYTSRQVGSAILVEHLAIACAACLVGNALAAVLAPTFRVGSLRVLEPSGVAWNASAIVSSTLVASAIVVVATLVPAVRAGRVDVVSALQGNVARRSAHRARPSAFSRLPLTAALGATAIKARPLRTAFSVGAVAIAIVAAIVSIAIDRSVDRVIDDPALAGDPASVFVDPTEGVGSAAIESALRSEPRVAGWYSVVDDRASVGGTDVHIRAIGGASAASAFVVGDGRSIAGSGDALAGYGLLRDFGWRLGDTVSVDLLGRTLPVTLVGWYRETEDTGRILQIGMDDYTALRPGAGASYAVVAADGTSATQLAGALRTALGPEAEVSADDTGTDTTPFRTALAVMTTLIAAVAAAHVLASVLTTSRERARAFAVQRAIGFDDRRLATEAALHGAAIGVLALAVGIPLGWWAQATLGDWLTREIGAGPGITIAPSAAQLATIVTLAIAGVAAMSLLATRATLTSRSVARSGD